MENSSEIVITGLGVVSAIGSGLDAFWNSLMDGTNGFTPYLGYEKDAILKSGVFTQFVGQVLELDKKRIRPRKSIKVMARDIQLGVAASDYAWEDAKLNETPADPERQGIVFGAVMPMADLWEIADLYKGALRENGVFDCSLFGNKMEGMYPLWMLKYLPNMTACHVGVANDLRGPSNTIVVGDVGGVSSVIEAVRAIDRGAADVMYTGGCNSSVMPQASTRFSMYQVSKETEDPQKAYIPFDVNREGLIWGECAGTTIIETRESAEKRGVRVYGKVLGYGETSEAVWNPGMDFASQKEDVKINKQKFSGKSIQNAIKLAMERANVKPEDLAFVTAHGLGSQFHDRIEAEAIAAVVGSIVPVTCFSSAVGYAFCGTSAVSVVGTVAALYNGIIPAIVNSKSPDSACPINLVMGNSRPVEEGKKAALVLAYNYYGQASALVIGK